MIRILTITFFLLAICSVRLEAACQTPSANRPFFSGYSYQDVRTTGTIDVRCDPGTIYAISLNAGLNPGSSTRNFLRPTDKAMLQYKLFSDASYTTLWGANDMDGTPLSNLQGNGNSQTYTIYAEIPAAQPFNVSVGGTNLMDTVTATITWTGGTATTTFNPTLQEVDKGGCGIAADALNFGNYSGALLQAQTTIRVNCDTNNYYYVGLNAGNGTGATTTTRLMTGPGGATLQYQMFSDAGYKVNWGNTDKIDTVNGPGTNSVQNLTVYGQIPQGQVVAPGLYTDTIIATLTY